MRFKKTQFFQDDRTTCLIRHVLMPRGRQNEFAWPAICYFSSHSMKSGKIKVPTIKIVKNLTNVLFLSRYAKKCKIMRITKKKQAFTSVLQNCTHFRYPTDEQLRNSDMFRSHIYLKSVPFELEEVNEFSDLGIATDQHLSWNLHIDKVVAKANRMLGLVERTCRDFHDRKTLRTLYCVLVRSNLEHFSLIWSLYTKRSIEKYNKGQLNLS